ncbi:hypothetical protein C8R26_1342 [Nitrosomonas oligotropha]|uniref:Fibronectin type-III domain-containing protein n=1 Tax=Nitrosomonas oligotropha TaxID=42354 RepID=A0A2T5HDK4_9PROT|nr:hypothetical protein [Nitrosomonas oligotropha]PTQ69636.1 hypothetical protein C8R26_1342 [Nitrosomonas oligotropha]
MNSSHYLLPTNNLLMPIGKAVLTTQFGTDKIFKPDTGVLLFVMMLLIATLSFAVTPAAYAANLLFKSNFGTGVALTQPTNFYANGAWQYLTGIDKETGHSWPIKAFGADFSGIQLITVDPINSTSIGNYITNEVRSVTGPKGNTIRELFQNVKINGALGQAGSQAPLLIKRPWTIGDVNNFYMTYWFKYPADFPSKLTRDVAGAGWRTQFEIKTGGYLNTWVGDYRIGITILKGLDGQLYWQTKGDNVANGPWPRIDYWTIDNNAVAVPIDKWFKFEVYWHRSGGSDGRFWAAVDGQVIADHYGPNMGDYKLPVTRIMVNNPYSGGTATIESHSTGLQIWDGFPCGDGVSCYNYDTTAPTTPTSLALKISKYSTAAGVALSWSKSSDNVAVAGYNIYRNGTKIGVTTANTFNDVLSGSAKGALYNYTVKALDAEENLSPASAAALVTY